MAGMAAFGASTRSSAGEAATNRVLRRAWVIWIALLFIPFLLFVYVLWSLSGPERGVRTTHTGSVWFIAAVAYMCLVVPAAAFYRSRAFRVYWQGRPVPPRDYLRGMLTMWLALEIGGLFSLAGCLLSRALVPGLLPGLVAFVLFAPLWPSGRAMVARQGNSDDPEAYDEPR